MNKKYFILISIFIILTIIFSTFILAVPTRPVIVVSLQSQSPDPVEPGQIVTLKFKIENTGAEAKQESFVKVLPKSPFTIYNDVNTKSIGKLRASATGADAEIVEFKFKVDEDAVEGENEIELEVHIGDSINSFTDDQIMVDIQTHDAVLDITSIKLEPNTIAPGQSAEMKITVKNLADSLLKDIKFDFDFAQSTLPLAPFESSSQRRIAQLETNRQLPLSFKIIADPAATSGLYKIPLNITYNDEKGNNYLIEDVVAILIGEEPDIKVYLKKTDVYQKKSPGAITIEIANTGTNDIKFLEMTLLESEDYELISASNYVYIGDIDSDDTETEEFDIFVNKVDAVNIPVEIKYSDANNKETVKIYDLQMPTYSTSKLKKFGVIGSSNAGLYVLIIILGIGGYYYYTRYYKKKKKLFKK
jgi:hypothetical protein